MSWDKFLDLMFDLISSVGIKLLSAIIVFIIGVKLIKWFSRIIKTTKKLEKTDAGVRSFLASFAVIALYIVLFITVAMILGIPTTSFIAALASAFAAIGLAMQGTLSNFAGGIMILVFKPFKVGDYICAPKEDAEGTVQEISLVYTILKTPDNTVITIPNGTLTNSVVKNMTSVEMRRVDVTFSTSYDCDIDKVKGILMDVLNSHPMINKDPEPTARLSEHADSALVYTVKAWCKTDDYWDVKYDLIETVKKEFDKNNIPIPFPQLDVHMTDEK